MGKLKFRKAQSRRQIGNRYYARPTPDISGVPVTFARAVRDLERESEKIKKGDAVTIPDGDGIVTAVPHPGAVEVRRGMGRPRMYHPSVVHKK